MPHIFTFLITFLIVILVKSTQLSSIKYKHGLGSRKIGFDEDKFLCKDGKTIEISSFNDEYCDCVCGSDEPGTSACSHTSITFQCTEVIPGLEQEIPTSRVNDGICDCCDGSDEIDLESMVSSCFNSCAEIRDKEAEIIIKKLEVVNDGLILKQNLLTSDHLLELREIQKLGSNDLRQELKQVQHIEKAVEMALDRQLEVQHLDQIHHKSINPEGVWLEERRERSSSSVEDVEDLLLQTFRTRSGKELKLLEYLEGINQDADAEMFDYRSPTNVDDIVQKSFFTPFLNGSNAIRIKLIKNFIVDTVGICVYPLRLSLEALVSLSRNVFNSSLSISSSTPPVETQLITDIWGSIKVKIPYVMFKVWNTGPKYINYYFPMYGGHMKRFEVIELHHAKEVIVAVKKKLENLIENVENAELKDYGPDNIYYFGKDTCFDFKSGEFRYSVCPLRTATQGTTSLGSWEGWEGDYTAMKYTGGQSCWNGPKRSLHVKLLCSNVEAVISVREPSICVYEMVFHTPRACTGHMKLQLEEKLQLLMNQSTASSFRNHMEL